MPGLINDDVNVSVKECYAIDVLKSLRKEVSSWYKEPAFFVPNYEAYQRFDETIDKKIAELNGGNK